MEADNYLALILWHKGPRFVIARRPQADVAIFGKAVTFSPMAFLLSAIVLRDSHVASLLGMTHQGGAVVHQCPYTV